MGLSSGFAKIVDKLSDAGKGVTNFVKTNTSEMTESFVDFLDNRQLKPSQIDENLNSRLKNWERKKKDRRLKNAENRKTNNKKQYDDRVEEATNAFAESGLENDYIAREMAKVKASTIPNIKTFFGNQHQRNKDFAGNIAAEIPMKVYGGAKWWAKKAFEPVVPKGDTFTGYNLRMKTGHQVALGSAMVLGSIGFVGLKQEEKSKLGEIEGGLMSKSVNATFSPATGRVLDSIQSGATSEKQANKTMFNRNMQSRLAGVNPEIVFAMHTLRNDKNMLGEEVVH